MWAEVVGRLRKPDPGMLLLAINWYEVSEDDCLMVGDRDEDQQAAQAAGVQFILNAKRRPSAMLMGVCQVGKGLVRSCRAVVQLPSVVPHFSSSQHTLHQLVPSEPGEGLLVSESRHYQSVESELFLDDLPKNQLGICYSPPPW